MPREERPVCAEMRQKLLKRLGYFETGEDAPNADERELLECISMEDMGALLIVAMAHGWKAPVDPETCQHPFPYRTSQGSASTSGESHMFHHCALCGKHWETHTEARAPEPFDLSMQPRNLLQP